MHLLPIHPFIAEMKVLNTYHRFNGTLQFSIATKTASTLKSNVRPGKTIPNEHHVHSDWAAFQTQALSSL